MSQHPDHTKQIVSLKRIEGQIRGIQRMINEGKYCVDILTQLRSVNKAIISVEENVLKTHVESCVSGAIKSGSQAKVKEKLDEIMKLIKKFMR